MRPQPKESNGVFGGGWERPSNVFMAARTFKRKMEATSNLNSKSKKKKKDAHLKFLHHMEQKKANCDTLVIKSTVLKYCGFVLFQMLFLFSS